MPELLLLRDIDPSLLEVLQKHSVLTVTMFVIVGDGDKLTPSDTILLLQKTAQPTGKTGYVSRFAGLWEVPGGTGKKYELPKRIVLRELYEETGIRLQTAPEPFAASRFLDQWQRPAVNWLFLIKLPPPAPTIVLSEEHDAGRIVTFRTLHETFTQDDMVKNHRFFLQQTCKIFGTQELRILLGTA